MHVSRLTIAQLLAVMTAILWCGVDAGAARAASADEERFFEQHVRPILANRCLICHGDETQESNLRLDSRDAILRGGARGQRAAVPGESEHSLIVDAIRYDGPLKMPPTGRLPDEEIALLTAWIEMGLPWPESATQLVAGDDMFEFARQRHWAYQPVERPERPAVQQADWPARELDYYVLARLEDAGLTPAPPADRRTLIRRASFALIGLPPTPEEVEAFVADDDPRAYERLIDRLLASPRYGERWARHWLDVARYADTKGYAFQRERRYPYAYTYRDWVIGALNDDLPYDQFVVKQLAADLLADQPDDPSLAALGFLTVGRRFNNAHDDIDDQIDAVTRGVLGMTVSCARCHDHKYDAIPIEDYYSLYGVFASTEEPSELPLIGDPPDTPEYREFQEKRGELEAEREAYLDEQHAALVETMRRHMTEYLVRAVSSQDDEALRRLDFLTLSRDDVRPRLVPRFQEYVRRAVQDGDPLWGPLHDVLQLDEFAEPEEFAPLADRWASVPRGTDPGQLNPLVAEALADGTPGSRIEVARRYGDLLSRIYIQWQEAGGNDEARDALDGAQRQLLDVLLADNSPTRAPRDGVVAFLNRAQRDHFRELQRRIESHEVTSAGAPPRAMVVADRPQPVEPQVFLRGNQARRGDRVPRRFLRVLAGDDPPRFEDGSGRLELARALVDPDNPLTRRVLVNRVWMHHFDEPLVETPDDFGVRSAQPMQSELLDYLAWSLLENGWSLKQLHREIMLSSTYQQASLLRDDCFQQDPENLLLWRMNPQRLEFEALRDSLFYVAGNLDEAMGGRPVPVATAPYEPRRAIYGFIDRQDLPNLLRVFDFASPDQSSARRPKTTVPQQALYLMNSPLMVQQARQLVARERVAEQDDAAEGIRALYRRVLTRPPSDEELDAGLSFLEYTEARGQAEVTAWEQYAQALLLSNEFTFVD